MHKKCTRNVYMSVTWTRTKSFYLQYVEEIKRQTGKSWFDDVTSVRLSLFFRAPSLAPQGGSQRMVSLAVCLSVRDNVKFLGGGPSAWPQRCGGKGRLNYSSVIAKCSTEINTKWVSWKWRLVLAGPGIFELAVKCANKSKSSRTPTSLRAPFKTKTPSRKIHFFRSFIAAFHVCYPALWVRAARHKPLCADALPKRVGVCHVLRYNRATVISAVHRKQPTADMMWSLLKNTARHIRFIELDRPKLLSLPSPA